MQELILKRKNSASIYEDSFGASHQNIVAKVISVTNNQSLQTLDIAWAVFHDIDSVDKQPLFSGVYTWKKDARVENDIPYSAYNDMWSIVEITNITKLSQQGIGWILNYQLDPVNPAKKWGEDWEIYE